MSDRGLFEPDVLITEQFVAARRRGAALSSEKRLMLAVLASALEDYQKYFAARDRAGSDLFADAAEWIENRDHQEAFSFESISETLDINPEYLRRGLAAWRERALEARCQATDGVVTEVPQPEAIAS